MYTLSSYLFESTNAKKSIFLAGGFSENKYLYNEVTKFARGYGHVNVYQAEDR